MHRSAQPDHDELAVWPSCIAILLLARSDCLQETPGSPKIGLAKRCKLLGQQRPWHGRRDSLDITDDFEARARHISPRTPDAKDTRPAASVRVLTWRRLLLIAPLEQEWPDGAVPSRRRGSMCDRRFSRSHSNRTSLHL